MLAGSEVAGERSDPTYGIYAYTAREWDPEINLYYYRARYYDPKIGRFISEDPIGLASGESSFYSYGRGNPVLYTDPTGLIIWHVNEERGLKHGVFPGGHTGIARPRVEPDCIDVCGRSYLVFHVYATLTQATAAPSSGGRAYAAWSQRHEDWHRGVQLRNLVEWAADLRPYERLYDSKAECEAAAAAAIAALGPWDPVKNNLDLDTRIMRWIFGIK